MTPYQYRIYLWGQHIDVIIGDTDGPDELFDPLHSPDPTAERYWLADGTTGAQAGPFLTLDAAFTGAKSLRPQLEYSYP